MLLRIALNSREVAGSAATFGLVNLLPVQSRGLLWLALLLCPPHPLQLNIHWMSEPGNCSVETQLGSTNSKGLPVLFQGLPPRNCY